MRTPIQLLCTTSLGILFAAVSVYGYQNAALETERDAIAAEYKVATESYEATMADYDAALVEAFETIALLSSDETVAALAGCVETLGRHFLSNGGELSRENSHAILEACRQDVYSGTNRWTALAQAVQGPQL